MCFFGVGAKAAPVREKPQLADAPPVVTGEQTGVDKPKTTAKATEKLRMARKDKEIEAGTYNDPNLGRTEELLRSKGGSMGAVEKNERAKRLKRRYSRGNPTKAQRMAKARQNKR